jgi:hypothetical protein
MREIGIGMVGAGFVSQLHAEAFTYVPEAHLRGVAAGTAASDRPDVSQPLGRRGHATRPNVFQVRRPASRR